MNFLKLTNDILVVDEILKLVSSEKCGAVSIFVGTTRDNFEGRQVKNLEYEAYESMAIKVMSKLCDDMREKWDQIHNIAIYHRLGTVPVLEASVVIAISSPHRVDSMAAVQYCIENLKALLDSEDNEQNASKSHTITADPNTVEINVSFLEMKNRIEKYTERKREQINMNNIQDFIEHNEKSSQSMNPDNSTCARVDAILLKSKDSKSHLKVLRTQNEWGPQTKIETESIPKESTLDNNKSDLYTSTFGVEERISTVENKLNVAKPIPADIYSRLKKIEDKILELESISPEYSKFWLRNASKNPGTNDNESKLPKTKKQKFSAADVWKRIKELEEAS